MKEQLYTVYNSTHCEDHTTRLTYKEALELSNHLQECFDDQYEIHPCYDEEPKEPKRYYNNNAVDGWEDMFSSNDY